MMLTRSFVHLPRVGPVRERKLLARGIRDWEHLLDEAPKHFNGQHAVDVQRALEESLGAWQRKDLLYFYNKLPRDQIWRLVPGHVDQIAYLDIETTGQGFPPACHSTTITFYWKGEVLQAHEPATRRALVQRMHEEAPIWCTFFGEAFDVPFLEREFDADLSRPHVDLCFWLKRLGFKGGLKKVQKLFSSIPDRQSMDIDGFDAVRLWRMHRQGVPRALETLLTYNAEDTVVLAPLLAEAYNLQIKQLSPETLADTWNLQAIAVPELPKLSTETCPQVYAKLRNL